MKRGTSMLYNSGRLSLLILLLLSAPAFGGVIDFGYSLTSLGGNHYRYDYSIHNNGSLGPGIAIQLFDIDFDPGIYDEASLQIVTPSPLNGQWSEQILASLPGLPALYDALAMGPGIADGQTSSGFAVQFDWLGPGLPGSQSFRIYNPNTFDLLQSGSTGPEPSFMLVVGIVLVYGSAKLRRMRVR